MNGPLRMYNLPQIIQDDFPVQLPKCMYTLKNVHSPRDQADGLVDHVSSLDNKLDISDKKIQVNAEMADLESRQNNILHQLAELKKEIESLTSNVRNQQNAPRANNSFVPQEEPIVISNFPQSVVIYANPMSPPFSLVSIQRLLQDNLPLAVTSYLHSSVGVLPQEARLLADTLTSFKPKLGVPVIDVRLIWKEINSNASIIIAHNPILGEVNILRFLSRLSNSKLNYDCDPNSYEIDSLLDECYLLLELKRKTDRSSVLQSFKKSLGKAQWLAGRSELSVADIAAFSAIKQCNVSGDLSGNLSKWYERCQLLLT
ncbi:aminoacyl tRNA synthase complex-interacting multifunctional protein 2 isoform X2 [Cylas formicarius]|uniref:aminoacyl tRNA synthase complex-interacting multifunctional protein 2 isoform X2 n=1 Tax=Cylas formicarius TaxID=197179 RepID=UPI0029583834|nr:aminoacyl tRNA synthase complex-interacting multifunctional protein 2 isoform X2 [Cylas formicarius]